MNLRKGDKVKIVIFEERYGENIPKEKRKNIFEVEKRFTNAGRSWRRRRRRGKQTYVKIKIQIPEDRYGRILSYIDIPIEHVIKVNTKMYEIRNKLIKAKKKKGETENGN